MIKNHIISNIKPFNDIFYKSCITNALFPVLDCFGIDTGYIIVNDILLYKQYSNFELEIEYYACKPIELMVSELGLNVRVEQFSHDIAEDIITSISQNKPVIIAVDCYYESIRKSSYLKEHLPNFILIYGFDTIKKTFNVLEHYNNDELEYHELEITFDDIKKSYDGYLRMFRKNDDNTFYAFEKAYCIETDATHCLNIYKMNIADHLDMIVKAHSVLEKFKIDLINCIINEEMIIEKHNIIIENLNRLINAYKSEAYKMSISITGDHLIKEVLEKLNITLILIRGRIVKFKYTMNYNKTIMGKCIQDIDEAMRFEKKYYNWLSNIDVFSESIIK